MPNDPFSAIAAALYKPKLQAVGVNDQGQYVDANNVPTTEFDQPGFLQRAFNPYADQIQMMNAQGQANPVRILQQAKAARYAAQQLDPTLTNDVYANTYYPRFSPQNRNSQNVASQFAQMGGVPAQAEAEYNDTIANQQLAKNRYQQAATAGLLGTPVTSAQAEDAQTTNARNMAYGQGALIPKQLENEGLTLGNQNMSLLGQRAIIPNENAAGLANSLISRGMAEQGVTDLPINTGTQRLNDIGRNYMSSMMPDEEAQTPLISHITPNGVIHSTGLNPRYMSPTSIQMQSLGRGMGPVGTPMESRMMPSGKTYNLPPVNAPVTPTMGTGYSPDEVKDKIDEHNDANDDKMKADHDAAQATIASQIAALKMQQKKLQASHAGSRLDVLKNTLVGMGRDAVGADAFKTIGSDLQSRYNNTKNWWTQPQ